MDPILEIFYDSLTSHMISDDWHRGGGIIKSVNTDEIIYNAQMFNFGDIEIFNNYPKYLVNSSEKHYISRDVVEKVINRFDCFTFNNDKDLQISYYTTLFITLHLRDQSPEECLEYNKIIPFLKCIPEYFFIKKGLGKEGVIRIIENLSMRDIDEQGYIDIIKDNDQRITDKSLDEMQRESIKTETEDAFSILETHPTKEEASNGIIEVVKSTLFENAQYHRDIDYYQKKADKWRFI